MKNLLVITVFILAGITAHSQIKPSYDVRKVNWGYSLKQVKNSEDITPEVEKKDVLIYKSKLAGMDCYVVYFFTNDKLTELKYSIQEEHSYENSYITDYRKLNTLLVKKYGTADRDDTTWYDDLYEDDPSKYGFAVSLGHLSMWTEWADVDTEISHVLTGDNYEIDHNLYYVSTKFKNEANKTDEKETLNDL